MIYLAYQAQHSSTISSTKLPSRANASGSCTSTICTNRENQKNSRWEAVLKALRELITSTYKKKKNTTTTNTSPAPTHQQNEPAVPVPPKEVPTAPTYNKESNTTTTNTSLAPTHQQNEPAVPVPPKEVPTAPTYNKESNTTTTNTPPSPTHQQNEPAVPVPPKEVPNAPTYNKESNTTTTNTSLAPTHQQNEPAVPVPPKEVPTAPTYNKESNTTTTNTPPSPTHQQNEPAAAIATKYLDKRFIQRLSKSFDHCIWPKCNLFGKQYFSLFTRTAIAGIAATIVAGIGTLLKIPSITTYFIAAVFIFVYFASFNLETEVIRFRCAKTPEHYELKCVQCSEEFVEENKVHLAAIEDEIKAINNSIEDCNARNKGQPPLPSPNEKRDDSVDLVEEKRKQKEALNALQHCREVLVEKIKCMESFIEMYRKPFSVSVKEYLGDIFPVGAWQEWIVFLRSKKAIM